MILMKKSKHSITHSIVRLVSIIPLFYSVISQVAHLIEAEAKHIKRKIIKLLITSVCFSFTLQRVMLYRMLFLYLVFTIKLSCFTFLVFILNLLLQYVWFNSLNMKTSHFSKIVNYYIARKKI